MLVDLGCADSKSLKEETRDKIFDDICEHHYSVGWAIEAISPNVIANNMYRRTKVSLNEISMMSATNLIRGAIEAGANITEVYVDTVGRPEPYQARLSREFPGVKIVVAKKADATYPIVSAASICAKVARDHALRAWQFREADDFTNEYGSGYPNDPATKAWLASSMDSVFGYPRLVRFSWSTVEQILESKALPIEWEETEEEEIESPNEQKIQKFFFKLPADSHNVHTKKHPFFTERCLSNATVL